MSAIRMTCPACEQTYMAGVVGSTPWPPHDCPLKKEAERLRRIIASVASQTALDVVADKMKAEDALAAQQEEVERLREANDRLENAIWAAVAIYELQGLGERDVNELAEALSPRPVEEKAGE